MLTRRCSTTMTDTEEASKVAVNDNDLDQQTKKTCLQKFIVKNPIVFSLKCSRALFLVLVV